MNKKDNKNNKIKIRPSMNLTEWLKINTSENNNCLE